LDKKNMADQPLIDALLNIFDALSNINLDAALRTDLGVISIKPQFMERIKAIASLKDSVRASAGQMENGHVQTLSAAIQQLAGRLQGIAGMQMQEFTNNRAGHVQALESDLSNVRSALLVFMVWFLFARVTGGLAQDIRGETATIRDEVNTRVGVFQNRFQSLEENATKMLNDLKAQTETVIENAKQLDLAKRQQFKEVSIDSSKLQFEGLTKRFLAWGVITGLLAAAMLGGLIWFLLTALNGLHEYASMQDAIAASVIRIALIGVLGAFAAILIKICRGNLNMYYHTMHRAHLATLIQQLVNAGENADQRGAIFIKMVDAIASFGSSGLISGSDDAASLKIVSDFLPSLLKQGADK
jgi:hypothetical protein